MAVEARPILAPVDIALLLDMAARAARATVAAVATARSDSP